MTSLTPSISCRRSSVSATSGWLVAHPASVNVGTVLAAVLAPLAPVPPTEPVSEEIEVFAGSTRPNSCRT